MPLIASLGVMNAMGFGLSSKQPMGYMVVGRSSSTYLAVYQFSSGFGTRTTASTGVITSTVSGVSFSKLNDYIICGTASSPYLRIFPWNQTTGIGTSIATNTPTTGGQMELNTPQTAIAFGSTASVYALSDPPSLGAKYTAPSDVSSSTFFSPDNSKVLCTISSTPYIRCYDWTDVGGFGTLYADPATLPSGTGNVFGHFNNAGNVAGVTVQLTSVAYFYKFSVSGFGTKFTSPTINASGGVYNFTFTKNDSYVFFNISVSPFLVAYAWDNINGFGSKKANPASLPTDYGRYNIAINKNQNAIAPAPITNNFSAYAWTDQNGFGTKYIPATTTSGVTCANFSN